MGGRSEPLRPGRRARGAPAGAGQDRPGAGGDRPRAGRRRPLRGRARGCRVRGSAAFRRGLSARGLAWAVGVLMTQNVYPPTVELRWPRAATGRPRKHPVPSQEPVAVEAMLANAAWRRISWRLGTMIGRADHPSQPGRRRQRLRGGPLVAEFAARRVRPAEGEQLRNGQHAPGDEVWLVGEHRASGERKYYLANLPAETSLKELAALIKARWAASRRTSSSRRSSASTTSRAG